MTIQGLRSATGVVFPAVGTVGQCRVSDAGQHRVLPWRAQTPEFDGVAEGSDGVVDQEAPIAGADGLGDPPRIPNQAFAVGGRGTKAYQQAYDLLYRREAAAPNEMWQADHTELDLFVLGPGVEGHPPGIRR